MKEPSLQTTTIFSLFIHITFLIIALIAIKNTNHFVMPSHYIVSLSGPEVEGTIAPNKGDTEVIENPTVPTQSLSSETSKNKNLEDAKQYAEDRIAAIEATRRARHILRLRNIISIKNSALSEEETTEISQPEEGGSEGDMLISYEKKIGREIWQYYTVIPEIKGKNLEAIISVTVMQDGSVRINKIEKSSGNTIFDRSVLKAISKASPVSKPPYEMEIGLRFTQ